MNINYDRLEHFWNWLIKGYPKKWFVEIRLMLVRDPEVFSEAQQFAVKNPDIIIRKNAQFFINKFEQIKRILEYNDGYFIKKTKICYSLNPRYYVNGEITGGYDNLKTQNTIFFDIEKVDHSQLEPNERIMIEKYTMTIVGYLKRYNLTDYTLVRSGGGIHLLYKIIPKKITLGRRESYKEFIVSMSERLSNETFHIDKNVIDMTRTVALPFSINPKNGIMVELVKLGGENNFFIRAKNERKKKIIVKQTTEGGMEVRKSLAYVILTNNAPVGNLNNNVLFYLKLLLRDYSMDYREFEREINKGYGIKWKLNTNIGTKGKVRNFGVIINWCKNNQEWCLENKIDYKNYEY